MKHTFHILILVIFHIMLFLPGTVLGDESDSFQNFGSVTDSASPSESTSDSFSAQDGSVTWRTTATDSDSYRAGGTGDTESESGDDSGGTSDGGGDDSGDSESGGRRGNGPPGTGPSTPSGPTDTADTQTPPTTPALGERPVRPAPPVASVAEPGPHQIPTRTVTVREPASAGSAATARPDQDPALRQAAPSTGQSEYPDKETSPSRPSQRLLASLTVGQSVIVGRLGWIGFIEGGFEAIPAYASGESLTGAAGFALRPGSVQIGALIPFFGRKRRKRRTQESIA